MVEKYHIKHGEVTQPNVDFALQYDYFYLLKQRNF